MTKFFAETWAKAARMCGKLLGTVAWPGLQRADFDQSAPNLIDYASDARLLELERRLAEIERQMVIVKSRPWGS